MMEDFIGAYGNRLIVAVVGVGVALLVLAIALWLLRRRSGSAPFIRGGRNRQPRLQVQMRRPWTHAAVWCWCAVTMSSISS